MIETCSSLKKQICILNWIRKRIFIFLLNLFRYESYAVKIIKIQIFSMFTISSTFCLPLFNDIKRKQKKVSRITIFECTHSKNGNDKKSER